MRRLLLRKLWDLKALPHSADSVCTFGLMHVTQLLYSKNNSFFSSFHTLSLSPFLYFLGGAGDSTAISYLSEALKNSGTNDVVQHGACLGVGLAAMATGDEVRMRVLVHVCLCLSVHFSHAWSTFKDIVSSVLLAILFYCILSRLSWLLHFRLSFSPLSTIPCNVCICHLSITRGR